MADTGHSTSSLDPIKHIENLGLSAPITPERTRISSLSFRSSPLRQSSPLNPQSAPSSSGARRRVRPVDGPKGFQESPRSRRASVANPARVGMAAREVMEQPEDVARGFFSDEYDLSHDDPTILQDVQRALKLKARREARLKAEMSAAAAKSAAKSDIASSSSLSNNSVPPLSPNKSPLLSSTLTTIANTSTAIASEIDFGPSTGASETIVSHPVPLSSDDGLTLDWSGYNAEEDKPETRWALSLNRRKGKERAPLLTTEQQEKLHTAKITKIKTVASPQTIRKALITSEQLGRRYHLVYCTLNSGSARLNIAKVSRWYRSQEAIVRTSLEKAEPFTWLKHLDKRTSRVPNHLPLHLSALIMEEYIHSQTRRDPMETIVEDPSIVESSPNVSLSPPILIPPMFSIQSRTSSHYSLGPSLSRRLSLEGGVSFEPLLESSRISLEAESRKSGDSNYSSLLSGSSNPIPAVISPASSRRQGRNFVSRLQGTLSNESDEASTPNSYSDHSEADKKPQHLDADSRSDKAIGRESDIKLVLSRDPSEDEGGDIILSNPASDINSDVEKLQPPSSRSRSLRSAFPGKRLRRRQTSLPSEDRLTPESESKRKREADEEKVIRDYQLKAQLLDEVAAQNHRVRQLLNRISTSVKEFEATQSNTTRALGTSRILLSRELLDAFGHDPAAVTGATRNFRGWRAVDDIHRRLTRQRDVFHNFLSHAKGSTVTSESVLSDPIGALMQSLESLHILKQNITTRADEVAKLSKAVQKTHVGVKTAYNKTLSHTSVVYPELSHIVALEESYKDQYQQVWEFGMDALTFLLDTVTPVWRTYGKTIGEDVRDFLIIPLYRNEFTGEAKRYRIKGFPHRSIQHWVGLLLFFMISVTVSVLQGRAAISSSAHYKLQWVPYESVRWIALPLFWIGIVIQWWAVLAEFAIVLAQVGILSWWAGWWIKIFN